MSLQIYVNEIPSCVKCPFNTLNINKEGTGKTYCLLKSQLASGQYGGINIIDYKKYQCPLKKVEDYLYVEVEGKKYPVKVKD